MTPMTRIFADKFKNIAKKSVRIRVIRVPFE